MIKLADISDIAGFGPVLRRRVQKEFPKEEWRDAPYRLMEVQGIGFQRADAVALALDVAPDSKERLSAGAMYVLGEAEQSGHTGLPIAVFGENLAATLRVELPDDLDLDADLELNGDFVSRAATAKAERTVAVILKTMMRDRESLPFIEMDGLKNDQCEAVDAIRRFPLFVLLGGPGVGKTHTIRTLVAGCDGAVALCAPTGKAAKRIEELAGTPAKTIHRLLGVNPFGDKDSHSRKFSFIHKRDNRLAADIVIVDESSMIDIRLMADLCEALDDNARLILVGDTFQLPAVGPGAVLRDLTQTRQGRDAAGSGGAPFFELTELKRQDPSLLIAKNCKAIRYEQRVIIDNKASSDFFFMPCGEPGWIADEVVSLVADRLPAKYGIKSSDVMVLTALREKGELSTVGLNAKLRKRLNPSAQGKFDLGDRVIQTSNNYQLDIMNGDIGTIVAMDAAHFTILFDTPERKVKAPRDDFDLMHAWALTVHRAQGSEWPWVVIPIHEQQGQMVVNANWLYTSISRARQGCVMVGSRAALEGAAARVREVRRWTRLQELMR